MKLKQKAIAAAAALMLGSVPVLADTYSVNVANLTYKQVVTPPLVVVHSKEISVFHPGDWASAGLKQLAETGDPSLLAEELEASDQVYYLAAGDPIPPGHNLDIMVHANPSQVISVLAMLATTNDGFVAALNVPVPAKASVTDAPVYDAGTEANTEDCNDIPGPPCDNGMNMESTADAEGFIHIHRGIHGTGDLSEANMDWRGAGARIGISRHR